MHPVAVGILHVDETPRPDAVAERRKDRVRCGQFKRGHQPAAKRERRNIRLIWNTEVVSKPQDWTRSQVLLQQHGGRVVGFEQRLAERQRFLFAGTLVAWNPDALR